MPAATDGPPTTARVDERRLVTVLFADLVGFTPFAEGRDAEEVRDTLSRYFDIASDMITRYGGQVQKFIGDAVVALWGAPVAKEDDAERAVRAGLDLVDAVQLLGPGIRARAGVLTGEAAVSYGVQNEGLVAGDMVNTAARLQSVASSGTVLVGEATHRAAASAIEFEDAGEQLLKGKSTPVRAWRALRVVAQRGGQGRSDMPEPPFTGREEEFRLLKDLVSATGRERKARLVSVTGPAGIGKSRLAWELEKYIDGVIETVYWHRGRSPAYGEGITFWALGEMVRRRAGLAETDDPATTRQRIAATVDEYVPDPEDRRWVEPSLLTLLGLEPAPAGGRDLLFAAWRIFIERVAAKGTTILLFEDLQWADGGLLDFITHLLEWSRGVPILVITLARPELFDRRPSWGAGMRNFTALALEALSEAAMRELVAGFVPGLPSPMIDTILARADGVPLYAVETVRSLVTEGKLERVDGTYRPVGQISQLAVPDSLRSLIASRLDTLDPSDRTLIQDASVIGQAFTIAGLAGLTGGDPAVLEPRLRGLVRGELLELEADPRSPERGQYRFVQSLIREVAHSTLARKQRRARHLAAARYFEALGDDELAAVVASHYLAAHEASSPGADADDAAQKARGALSNAARRAATLGAHEQAVAYLKQALEVTSAPGEQAELLMRAGASANAGLSYSLAEDLARRAVAAYEAVGDQAGVANANALLGQVLVDAGQTHPAIKTLEAALARLPESGVEQAKAVLLSNLSRALFRNEQAAPSLAAADQALTLAERFRLSEVITEAFINKAAALLYLGRSRESGALEEAAIDMAERHGFISAEIRARHNRAVSLMGDEPLRALEMIRGTLELSRRVGNRNMAAWSAASLGLFSISPGVDWDTALQVLEESLVTAEPGLELVRLVAAELLIRAARGESVAEQWRRVEAEALRLSNTTVTAIADHARSQIAFARGDFSTAYEAAMRAAVAIPSIPALLADAILPGLLQRDVAAIRVAVGRLEEHPDASATTNAHRIAARAGLAALEGKGDAATAGYREALQRYRALGLDFMVAKTVLVSVVLGTSASVETEAAAQEARATFERLRARPYLDQLADAMSKSAARI